MNCDLLRCLYVYLLLFSVFPITISYCEMEEEGGGGFKEFPGTVGHLSEHSEVYFYSSLTKSGLILPLVGQSYICEISAL